MPVRPPDHLCVELKHSRRAAQPVSAICRASQLGTTFATEVILGLQMAHPATECAVKPFPLRQSQQALQLAQAKGTSYGVKGKHAERPC